MQKIGSLFSCILFICSCSEKENNLFYIAAEEDKTIVAEAVIDYRFESGDLIGVYPVGYRNGQPGIPGDIMYPINVPFVLENNVWKPQGQDYFFTGEEKLDLYAYYPYDPELGSIEGKLDISAYKLDLSGSQAGKNLDILWASSMLDTRLNNSVDFEFKHVFSKITIRINLPGTANEDIQVRIYNLFTSALVNLRNGNVSYTTDKGIISATLPMEEIGDVNMVEAIVPPQTIEVNTPLFLINIGERITIYTTDRNIELQQGVNYTFDLTLV